MSKKLFKATLTGIIAFALAVLIGYTSYIIALNHALSKNAGNVCEPSTAAAEVYGEELPGKADLGVDTETYIARLENNTISIFAVTDGRESFLYSLSTYIGDIPENDLRALKEGVYLSCKEDLAKFEEDYTS